MFQDCFQHYSASFDDVDDVYRFQQKRICALRKSSVSVAMLQCWCRIRQISKKVSSECAELFEKCLKAHNDVFEGAKHVSHQCEAQAIEFEKKLGTMGHEGFLSFTGQLTSFMDSDTSSSSNEEKFKSTIHNLQDVSGRATALKEDKERYRRFYENFKKIVHILRNLLVPVKCLAENVQVLETIVTISPGKV